MRIILIQHGLTDRHTHFYGETHGWIDVLRRRKLDHRIFVHQDADAAIVEECGAEALFSFVPGARTVIDPVTDQLDSYLRFSAAFAENCAGLGGDLDATDVVIVAFATERELFGAAQWLSTVPERRRPHIVFHFVTPDFRWAISEDRQSITGDVAFYRFAANQLAEISDRFHFFASNEKLRQALRGAFDRPVSVAPIPMLYREAADLPALPEDPVWRPAHIGFVGEYRKEKGAAVLPEVIERFCRERPERRFLLQVQHEEQAKLVHERLGHLGDLEVHTGQLSHRAYVARLGSLDILLLPYMPARYAIRTSGIFAEAVAYGLVSVVPDKSLMSDQLAAGQGSGVTFSEFTADAIVQALIEASDGFDSLKDKAMACRAAWRKAQSLDALLDRILDQVRSAG